MPYQATVFEVFIATPSDVEKERQIVRKVVDEWESALRELEAGGLLEDTSSEKNRRVFRLTDSGYKKFDMICEQAPKGD